MSEKKEKPWFQRIRKIWERHPASHVKKSAKSYSRQQNKKIVEKEKDERNDG